MSTHPDTGRQVQFCDRGKVELIPQPRPTPSCGKAVLRNLRTLISSGTELAVLDGLHNAMNNSAVSWVKYPHHPGYAAVGVVESTMPGGPAIGQRVLYCGQHADWGVLAPEDLWVGLPDGLPDDVALLARIAQIAGTAAWTVPSAPLRVAVQGLGLVGLFAAQWYRLRHGSRVVGIDMDPGRRALAAANGLEMVLTPGAGLAESMMSVLHGDKPEVVVEATGRGALLATALELVRRGGLVQLLGAGHGVATLDAYQLILAPSASITGIHECSLPNRAHLGREISRQDLLVASVAALADGRLRSQGLITSRFKPEQTAAAYDGLRSDPSAHLGVILEWA